jgi:hypothetical protein
VIRTLTLIALTAFSGCAEKHEFVTTCRGPLVVLNTDKWQPSKTDVAVFESICPEGR